MSETRAAKNYPGMMVTKIAAGYYGIALAGRRFYAEALWRRSEGANTSGTWVLFEVVEGKENQYWNHFGTLKLCKDAVSYGVALEEKDVSLGFGDLVVASNTR